MFALLPLVACWRYEPREHLRPLAIDSAGCDSAFPFAGWSGEDILTVPVGALFRQGEDWAVFSLKDGRASTAIVKIGHRNGRMAEVLSGLSSGDRVILHPSDRVRKGVAVSERESG